MSLPQPLLIPDHVMARQVGDETVILDLESGMYYGLDAVGSRFWQLLAQDGSTERVRNQLLAEFEVPALQLDQDLDALISELVSRGLLRQG